ncbi:MAG: hypothetical protein IPH28_24925 [Cytophagaceae bacterium]|nr:hypothetical protein [Cytophagaceae bacterium]
MKYLIIAIAIGFLSCKDDFAKEKYDVNLNFEKKTQSKIKLTILEINNKIKWEKKEILTNGKLSINFNIKRDIGSPEGGFIFKAYFEDGDSIVTNTGYYTNYQFQDKSPIYYNVTKNGFQVL